jgi:hypothetical protein
VRDPSSDSRGWDGGGRLQQRGDLDDRAGGCRCGQRRLRRRGRRRAGEGVVDYDTKQPVDGVVVRLAEGSQGTTDATGAFAIEVPANVAYSATITAPDHVIADFGEIRLSGDHDQGTFVLSSLAHSVQAREFMGNYDATKAVLLVSIVALPGCSGIAGSTVAVEPAGAAKVRYFLAGKQSFEPAAFANEEPAAIVWNVEPNVPVSVKVTSPACTQPDGPVAAGSATFSGQITAKAGGDLAGQLYLTYVRAHLR